MKNNTDTNICTRFVKANHFDGKPLWGSSDGYVYEVAHGPRPGELHRAAKMV
jgi:hypothetical protein